MAARVKSGTVIYRHWHQQAGLSEVSRTFTTLNELFALCLNRESDLLVDRIVLDGEGGEGEGRSVTLVFQSVRVVEDSAKNQAE